MSAGIELKLHIGRFGERTETVALPISEDLLRELMETVELSDDPVSTLVASPGMYGGHGDAITHRNKTFAFRRETAREIGRLVERALIDLFGANDQVNGYRRDQWSEADKRQADYVKGKQ